MRSAVAFLTTFGRSRPPGATTFDWFPVVGLAIGALLGGVWWGASRLWAAPVAGAVVVAADLAVTGMLHFDGLVDAADGLLAHLPRERRLAVMATPGVGAFGVAAGAVAILLRWAALSATRPAVLLLAALWCLSRTAMAVVARTQPYARDESGLPSAFAGGRRWLPLGAGAAAAAGLACAWKPAAGAAAVAAGVAAAAGTALLARRRLGGYTGDVLGACGILAETAGLLVAAARW